MVKTKSLLIYIISTSLVLLLFSSFDAEFYFSYTTKLNLTDQVMYYAFTSDFDQLTSDIPNENKSNLYQLNDESAFISDYKFILYYLDYLGYPEDNVFDADLQNAVQKYQQDKALEVTGTLNSDTMTALDAEVPEYRLGQKGNAILKYQQILKDLNYISEETEINGAFGAETKLAVEQYQTKNALTVTGTINTETQTALNRNQSQQMPANQ